MTDGNNIEKQPASKVPGFMNEAAPYLKGAAVGALALLAGEGIFYLIRKNANVPGTKEDVLKQASENMTSFKEFLSRKKREEADNETFEDSIESQPYLWFDGLIHKGEKVSICAPPKTGKTFAAISIAENPEAGKVLFVVLDDADGQMQRFNASERCGDMQVYTGTDFEKAKLEFEGLLRSESLKKATWDSLTPKLSKIFRERDKILKELGVKDDRYLNNICILECMMNEIGNQFDTIIIDNVNRLFGNPQSIVMRHLDKVLKSFGRKQTVILLHHINKQGFVSGGSAFSEVLDSVITLSKQKDGTIEVDASCSRYPQKFQTARVQMISTSPYTVEFKLLDTDVPPAFSGGGSNLDGKIMAILESLHKITFKDLTAELFMQDAASSETSIKNALKRLENRGLVAKADGKTWNVISLVSSSSSAGTTYSA